MLKLFIILGLLVLLYFLIRGAVRELRSGHRHDLALEEKDHMVQDPFCRVYVPQGTAVSERIGGQTYYFCSRDCAQAFQKELSG